MCTYQLHNSGHVLASADASTISPAQRLLASARQLQSLRERHSGGHNMSTFCLPPSVLSPSAIHTGCDHPEDTGASQKEEVECKSHECKAYGNYGNAYISAFKGAPALSQ